MYTLYDYFRSTASYRVRIVFEVKKLSYKRQEVHLVKRGGEQYQTSYLAINPQKLVPTLYDKTEQLMLSQSLAIIDYLEAKHPSPSIYTQDPVINAKIKSFAQTICCDIHPLNNLRVLKYLKNTLEISDDDKTVWYHQWLHEGFKALEILLSKIKRQKPLCFSDKITLADICLVPQMYNAHRFTLNLKDYPLLSEINTYCLTLEPFKKAAP